MRYSEAKKLFLLCFVAVFAVLLFSGAPRLIASDGEEHETINIHTVQAYLCAVTNAESQSSLTEGGEINRFAGRCEFTVFSADSDANVACDLLADANGNVLSETSYMRSVYQVFALGDGFV